MRLDINLKEKYRSFNAGTKLRIDGKLAIISGVNGAGKSQLFDIVRRIVIPTTKRSIAVDLSLDGEPVAKSDVAYRSFKENINLPVFKHANPDIAKNSKEQIWQHYHTHKLNRDHPNVVNHQDSCMKAKAQLIGVFGEEKFMQGLQAADIIQCTQLDDVVWKTDDIFENVVSEIFYNFANEELHAQARAGKTGTAYCKSELGEPPWLQLNGLFEKFRLGYRFKENYQIADRSHSLDETPKLFQVSESGEVDTDSERDLNDLSDGEKAIISLAFSSLTGVEADEKKLLLFDEFDATLNPSLTKVFYQFVEELFVKHGVMVVIATHSPVTISLAPEYATFYEMFRSNQTEQRLIPVQRDSYAELQIANQKYLDEISNQSSRIEQLTQHNGQLKHLIQNMHQPAVYVEGPTDVKYIKRALELYGRAHLLKSFELEPIGRVTIGGTVGSNDRALENAGQFLRNKPGAVPQKTLLLHDPENKVKEEDVDGKVYIRKMSRHESSPISKGIESLFPEELIENTYQANKDWFTYQIVKNERQNFRILDGQKSAVCEWICANASKNDFARFEQVFPLIELVLDQE